MKLLIILFSILFLSSCDLFKQPELIIPSPKVYHTFSEKDKSIALPINLEQAEYIKDSLRSAGWRIYIADATERTETSAKTSTTYKNANAHYTLIVNTKYNPITLPYYLQDDYHAPNDPLALISIAHERSRLETPGSYRVGNTLMRPDTSISIIDSKTGEECLYYSVGKLLPVHAEKLVEAIITNTK